MLLCVNLQPLSRPALSPSLRSWPKSSGIMQMLHTLQYLLTRTMHLRSHIHALIHGHPLPCLPLLGIVPL